MTINRERIHWMDNLRTFIIFIVVLYHVGGVYESSGLWGSFWIVDDPSTMTWVGIPGIVFDLFMMPTMFFISGYLTPRSLEKKSGWEFVKGKFKRLIIPWLLAVFTLIPIYRMIFLYSRSLPQENWVNYFYFIDPNSQKWLWFLPLLFVFDLIYLVIDKLGIKIPKISLAWMTGVSIVLSLSFSYVIGSWAGFLSWTSTPILDFENERLLAHFLFYIGGTICYRRNVFTKLTKSKSTYILAISVAWLPVIGHVLVRLWPFFEPGLTITPLYRFLWFMSFHLSSLMLVYILVESFRFYMTRTGKLWGVLNRNSYGVYIIHVVLIGVFGTLLLSTNLQAVVKWFLLIILACVGSNLLVSLKRSGWQALKFNKGQSTLQLVDEEDKYKDGIPA